jgi:NAD(P)-dependent dehydrogenase (short-subunit alcohol dehydrogenase family)
MSNPARVALVTGGAGDIGFATAQRLATAGVRLCLVDLDAAKVSAAAATLAAGGAQAIHAAADVTEPAAVEAFVARTVDAFRRVDILVNVAGGAGPRNLHQIDDIGLDDWDSVIALNLRSTFLCCRAVVPHMRRQAYGRIVNTSSTIARGKTGPVGTAGARLPYAAAKAGILGLTAQLAKDVGEFGITVNAVMPWLTLGAQGSRIRTRYEALTPEAREKLVAQSPLRRPATADEVAAVIAFLASEDAAYVSGTGLPVDGGFL